MVDTQLDHRLTPFRAFLFDLDGVVTPTVTLHMRAWRETFNQYFAGRGLEPFRDEEYYVSLDGRPRFDGVATVLFSRGIELAAGTPADDDFFSIWGIGNRKNRVFADLLAGDGIDAYPGTIRLLDVLAQLDVHIGLVSSSRNAEAVLAAAGVRDRFEVVVDGLVAAADGLPGKPNPDTYVAAAERLGAAPAESVVFEDAESGVAAGRAGGFGLVVGVDRGAGADALRAAGADLVVADLDELVR